MPGFLNRGGRRVDSPRERQLAERLEQAASGEPASSRPLQLHASPFAVDVAAYLRAAAGPPAWSRRLVRIQQLSADLRDKLGVARSEHERIFAGRPEAFAFTWMEYVNSVDLAQINELIDKHNLYYPIEAGLRMQWPSGRYILPEGIRFPLPRITIAELFAEFPTDAA